MFVAAAGETFWKGGFDSFFLVSMGVFYNILRLSPIFLPVQRQVGFY